MWIDFPVEELEFIDTTMCIRNFTENLLQGNKGEGLKQIYEKEFDSIGGFNN